MTTKLTVLVVGGTGAQGAAVVEGDTSLRQSKHTAL